MKGRARHRTVFVAANDLIALLGRIGGAERDLILNRAVVLEVGAVATVDYRSHN
jgi:hypothetical protein